MERQIDYILIDRYLRSKLKDIYSSNDLDLGSDHKALIARFGFSTSLTRRTRQSKRLKDTKIRWHAVDTNGYTEEVGRQLRDTELQSDITQRCEQIESVVIIAASDNQSNDLSQKRPQRSNELLNDLVMQRKMLDNKATKERSHLSKLIKKEIRIHKRLQRRTQIAGILEDFKNLKNISGIKSRRKKELIPSMIDANGKLCGERQAIADVFASFYESLYAKHDQDTPLRRSRHSLWRKITKPR